jgi:simple sugar transport system ATP-binding protein
MDRYGVTGRADQALRTLSGGNIQKLILAREIEQHRDYIVFADPARGLDASAAAAVSDKIRELRDGGAAVILISTNLDEILALADRVIVLYRGAAAADVALDAAGDGSGGMKERLGRYMTGWRDEA